MTPAPPTRHDFAIDRRYRALLALFGVRTDRHAAVDLDDQTFSIRFGFWTMRTPAVNLADAQVLGPFRTPKVLGVHLSFADRGVTFGTNAERGVCVRFHEPVPGIEPFGLVRHPGVTVTVADPDGLARAVGRHTASAGS